MKSRRHLNADQQSSETELFLIEYIVSISKFVRFSTQELVKGLPSHDAASQSRVQSPPWHFISSHENDGASSGGQTNTEELYLKRTSEVSTQSGKLVSSL